MPQRKVGIEPNTSWSLLGNLTNWVTYPSLYQITYKTSCSVDWTLEVCSLHASSFLACTHPHAFSIACILMPTLLLALPSCKCTLILIKVNNTNYGFFKLSSYSLISLLFPSLVFAPLYYTCLWQFVQLPSSCYYVWLRHNLNQVMAALQQL